MLNLSGEYQQALAILTEGPLSLLAAVSRLPEGDEQQRPPRSGVKSREFASAAHQQTLHTAWHPSLDQGAGRDEEHRKN